jgi:polysaccharide deacetylase 2 family uncharacterized protein YibQ
LSKKKRKKHHDLDTGTQSGIFQRTIINSLLFLSLTLIITSLAILIYSILEDKTKKTLHAPAPVAPPAVTSDALIQKMGEIVTAEVKPEPLPSESDDYERALELIKPKEEALPKKEPVEKMPPKPVIRPVTAPKPKPAVIAPRPQLAIVIDDVSTHSQVQSLLATNIPLSLSIFPPTSSFPSTPKIARGLDFYMIHLPLEALNFNRPQEKTLMVTSSSVEIEGRVKEIRRLFPSAHIVNNHTGSKFTADAPSMTLLLSSLKKHGFVFVDSKTTAKSKAKQAGEAVVMNVVARDIFLDNVADVAYIQGQLKKAVEMAKKSGRAVAIGHPRESTIEALNKSHHLLKEVQIVYMKELL